MNLHFSQNIQISVLAYSSTCMVHRTQVHMYNQVDFFQFCLWMMWVGRIALKNIWPTPNLLGLETLQVVFNLFGSNVFVASTSLWVFLRVFGDGMWSHNINCIVAFYLPSFKLQNKNISPSAHQNCVSLLVSVQSESICVWNGWTFGLKQKISFVMENSDHCVERCKGI